LKFPGVNPLSFAGRELAMTRQTLERVWKEHIDAEFLAKDVEADLATMTDDVFGTSWGCLFPYARPGPE
jgi:hypothetical protein